MTRTDAVDVPSATSSCAPAVGAMASGASVVIDGAQVFDTLDAAIADCSFVLATTARPRELALPVYDPAAAADALAPKVAGGARCAVLFGGERAGLSNEDTARADGLVSIPVNPAFASLNLAQAVLVVAYEWARASGKSSYASALEAAAPASKADFEHFFSHLDDELEAGGFFFPPEKKPVMVRNLRAALTRGAFTEAELRTLRGVIKALVKGRGRHLSRADD